MATDVVDVSSPDEAPDPVGPKTRGRRGRTLALLVIGVVAVLLAGAAFWFFVGREPAVQLSDDEALSEFRAGEAGAAAPSSTAPGRPAAGVYAATASGTESIGLPGFDETLGPNAPVTVTHGEGGCYTFRVDLNSQHWRSWTFCPSASADFALVELRSWTARRAPGLDLDTLTTYTCDRPLDVRWQGAAAGATRTGACSGRSDLDDAVTLDAAEAEVLEAATATIGSETIEVQRLRIDDTFSQAQTGYEVGEWWFDADSGLPVRVAIEAELSGGSGSYAEDFVLELSTLVPAT